jgi:hypothetical protein
MFDDVDVFQIVKLAQAGSVLPVVPDRGMVHLPA